MEGIYRCMHVYTRCIQVDTCVNRCIQNVYLTIVPLALMTSWAIESGAMRVGGITVLVKSN